MLAPREYKTAVELGLNHIVYDALCEVLRRMECGEIRDEQFDMSTACGTPCCFLGHARKIAGKDSWRLFGDWSRKKDLAKLIQARWGKTVEQGAYALRAYLMTGTPDWSL
jgi:hypothetical protein